MLVSEDNGQPIRVSPYGFKPYPHSSHRILLDLMSGPGNGRRVLDVGCGQGQFSSLLAGLGYEVVALDHPDAPPPELPDAIRFVAADLDVGLPPIEGGFDFIVCADVLEHVRDPRNLLIQLRALLGRDGVLIASLPNSANFYVRLNVLFGRFPDHERGLFDRTHLHFYNWTRWKKLLSQAGYRIEQTLPTAVPVPLAFPQFSESFPVRVLGAASWLAARLRKQFFAYQFVVTARAGATVVEPALPRVAAAVARRDSPAPVPARVAAAGRARVVVVMPAYNAAKTLSMTYADLPHEAVDLVILVDDGSRDETVRVARELGLAIFSHDRNYGYGANQKTCYREALRAGAEIVVMVHPDYQYDPTLLPEIIRPIEEGRADIVLGSRLLGSDPRKQGMPWWKYRANRFLTKLENVVFGLRLAEYHTGYRAFNRDVLESVNFAMNSDAFIFDQEILAQAVDVGARIAEMPVPTRYFPQASSASFLQSSRYGCQILSLLARFLLHRSGLLRQRQFESLLRRYTHESGAHTQP
jgi:SAM-dependent methyltransferase